MLGRVVEICGSGRYLSLYRGFLVVSNVDGELARVPLDDLCAVIGDAYGLTWSQNILVELANRGVPVVLCGSNHAPVAWLWPVVGHHAQTLRMHKQIGASVPLRKRIWQQLVQAKLRNQAEILNDAGADSTFLLASARRVRSGDAANLEAQAASHYWPSLLGANFRRNRELSDINGQLNYGYTVLRSAAARAIAGAGLHPSIGVHHHHRNDPFCLVDDIMEPFRPLVDLKARKLYDRGVTAVNEEAKRELCSVLEHQVPTAVGLSPVRLALERLAYSLTASFENGKCALDLPFRLLTPERPEAA